MRMKEGEKEEEEKKEEGSGEGKEESVDNPIKGEKPKKKRNQSFNTGETL